MLQDTDWHKSNSYALVAIGANLASAVGRPEQTVAVAIEQLASHGFPVKSVSSFYSTPCFPSGSGPDYVNAAVLIETNAQPEDLLTSLHAIEAQLGRERNTRWRARTLDLDLIAFGDAVLPDRQGFQHWLNLPPQQQASDSPDRLILPHPRLQDRAFVLIPLADVAPDWRHPVLGKTVAQMLDALPESEKQAVCTLETLQE